MISDKIKKLEAAGFVVKTILYDNADLNHSYTVKWGGGDE